MSIAIECYFDVKTEYMVRQIWQDIAAMGIKSPIIEAGYRPHISLAVYNSDENETAQMLIPLQNFTENTYSFPLMMSHIGIFASNEGVVFLGVGASSALTSLHRRYHRSFSAFQSKCRSYYLPGKWVPHCTIAYGLSTGEMATLVNNFSQMILPIEAAITEIGMSQVWPTRCDQLITYQLILR